LPPKAQLSSYFRSVLRAAAAAKREAPFSSFVATDPFSVETAEAVLSARLAGINAIGCKPEAACA
jgi:hypothetical protein